MSNEQMSPFEERYFVCVRQTVTVDDFEAPGYVLDVGGSGEGIAGLLKGDHVVAIDLRKSKREEAPDGPLKIAANARDLPFLERTIDTAAAFFSPMYLNSRSDCGEVFAEVHRVLKPGGRFLVWEANVSRPPRPTSQAT
jgi:ubiquinone/menaquinone biosynthesis C-methylase UbiE